MSQNQTQTTIIPNFAFPSEKVKDEKKYFEIMSKSEKGNYLFSRYGFWHGGIHLGEDFGNKICSIADGEIVAYRVNEKYLQNADEKDKTKGFYSTGFFLIRHKLEYPANNKLTFFSLYMHTAKKQEYLKEEFVTRTKGKDIFLRKGYESSAYSPAVGNELPSNTKIITDGNWINNRARVLYVEGRDIDLSLKLTIHKTNVNDSHKKGVSKLEEIYVNKKYNEVIVLPTPIKIKAGEVIGLMGEYNASEQSNNKVTHLEVFTSDDFKRFVKKARAQDKKLAQSFNWAKIIDVESKDHISIFDDISNFLLPVKYQTDEIKMNKSYEDLFKLIDKDHDGKMEVQEIKDAVVNQKIKEITSKYIVKHSSEWDEEINMAEVLSNFFEKHEKIFSDIVKLKSHYRNERIRIERLEFYSKCKKIEGFPKEDKVYHIHPIGLIGAFGVAKCYCLEQGIVKNSCNGNGISINNEHYEKLSKELGVEKEVLQAVAEVESGSRGAFQRENPKHATILYERHYFRNFITKVSTINNANNTVTIRGIATLNGEENTSEVTVSNNDYRINQRNIKKQVFYEASQYFSNKYPNLVGDRGNYGSYDSQLNKLQEAKKLNKSFAIQSCSWGKFQVMGSNYRLLYSTPQEIEIAQNQCELQHLQLFKSYLNNVNIINDMKNKNWREIARKYNGPKYEQNNYHVKMENSYKRLKGIQ